MPSTEQVFFRVLTSREAILRWSAKEFTASHCLLPGEWINLYYSKGERNVNAYPLTTDGRTYLPKSRDAFVEYAAKYGVSDRWDRDHLCAVSEVDGVFAWTTPALGLEYAEVGGAGSSFPIAVFEGVQTGDAPEPGGICARVTKEIEVLMPAAFRRKYCS